MASPPTGTVTFLFTDIEGSTRLWEHDAPAMQAALARHDEILRSVIEEHGGYVFKTVEDRKYSENARRLQQSVRRADGKKSSAEAIWQFATNGLGLTRE